MKYAIEIMGLDADFNIVGMLKYSNLQWRRRYFEAGTFSVQIPIDQYDSSIKYIYTKDRPEVGEISQINYIESKGSKIFALSGFFLEEELNRRIAYKLATTTNISNAPSWATQSGSAEDVATAFFNAFKDLSFTYEGTSYNCELGIETASSQGRGKTSGHERGSEKLGDKIYSILKPSEMSFRVKYNFLTNKKTFECWKGRDLTQLNDQNNNPVIFSTRYGNMKNPNLIWSDSEYKNGYIAINETTSSGSETVTIEARLEAQESDSSERFIRVYSDANRADYSSQALFEKAIHTDGHSELLKHKNVFSFDFDTVIGSYDYMTDFDLGDKCSIEVKEIGISQDAVLISIDEVIKSGTWTMTMEFNV